jgi:hypothetical protein
MGTLPPHCVNGSRAYWKCTADACRPGGGGSAMQRSERHTDGKTGYGHRQRPLFNSLVPPSVASAAQRVDRPAAWIQGALNNNTVRAFLHSLAHPPRHTSGARMYIHRWPSRPSGGERRRAAATSAATPKQHGTRYKGKPPAALRLDSAADLCHDVGRNSEGGRRPARPSSNIMPFINDERNAHNAHTDMDDPPTSPSPSPSP